MSKVTVIFTSGLPQEKLSAIVDEVIQQGERLIIEDHVAFAEVMEVYDVGITEEDVKKAYNITITEEV